MSTSIEEQAELGVDRARALDDDHRHVFHSWSAQDRPDGVVVAGGGGSWFWDADGKRYLDFSSQLVFTNLGHQHPAVVAAIQRQAERLCAVGPSFVSDVRGELARLIVERAPQGMDKVFFTNGGTEANEHAIRLARVHTGRQKVLSQYRSYHGATSASITATGDPRRWGSEPGIPGVVHFMGPYLYRSPFHASDEAQECERALEHLAQVIEFEGSGSIAAILLETVVGTNGVLVPPDGYLAGVRELCDRSGIVMICDEVMAGFGRVGEWFAVQAWGVRPDLISFAKGVNSGYVPLGGVVISEEIAATFAHRVYPGGLTYSGHPLACAAGVATIRAFEEERILERVRRLGEETAGPRLRELASRHPSVGEVRGRGLFWALELVRNRGTREMLVPFNAAGEANRPMAEVVAACTERGLWPFTHFNRIHVVPPLVISAEDFERGVGILDQALSVADRYVTA